MTTATEETTSLQRMDTLPLRVCSIVRRIDTDSDDIQRLKTLGVCVGRQIELIKSGDPIIIRVFGSRLGMSSSLAARVWVEACAPGHCVMHERPCK